jgi:hypothetical protein
MPESLQGSFFDADKLGKKIAPRNVGETTIKNDDLDMDHGAKQFVSIDTATALIAQLISYKAEYGHNAFLKQIHVGVKNLKKDSEYKLRFFAASADGKPGEELSDAAIIGKSPRYVFHPDSNNNYTSAAIDLIQYGIPFPETGIFVALELMYFKENEMTMDFSGTSETVINPFFMVTGKANENTWEFHAGKWVQLQRANEIAMKLSLTK